jgi:8-amino-7-oxononanoate synthase
MEKACQGSHKYIKITNKLNLELKAMFERELKELKEQGLLRAPADREANSGHPGTEILINGRKLINFASNDYLGLCRSKLLEKKSELAIRKFGSGPGAARLLAGGTALHKELETEAARYLGREAAILFNSGYHANTGAIPALARGGDIILSDELNHASIIDGCRLSRAKTIVFEHKNITKLETLLRKNKKAAPGGKIFIITESVFSMDGDIAALDELYGLAGKYNCALYVDEAHAIGVLGKGRGGCAHFGMKNSSLKNSRNKGPLLIQMGTFGKALGSYGAFIAAEREVIQYLQNTARTYLFSTALPVQAVAASLASLALLSKEKGGKLMAGLWRNQDLLRSELSQAGFRPGFSPTESPIIPLLLPSAVVALRVSGYLLKKGFYAPAIRPPTVKVPRLRLTVTAAHNRRQILGLVQALEETKKIFKIVQNSII